MRYIARYIDPRTGKTHLGASNTLIGRYVSEANARRYFCQYLRYPHFPAGQYELSEWPDGTFTEGRFVGYLYKTATREDT